MICQNCQRDFPEHLIQPLEYGILGRGPIATKTVCPLCAYKIINRVHGLPRGRKPPRSAPIARQLYMEALAHVKNKTR